MGTYSKPGTAVSPMMVDKSMSLLSKELGVAGDALIRQKENILMTQNKIAADNAILDQRVHSAQGGANLEFKDNLINTLSTNIDDIQKLGLNSIGRDQTEYMRAKAGLATAVDQLPKLLAVLDEEAKAYNNVGDGARKILNSTDPLAREFMNDIRINNGKNVRSEVVDGNVVLKYTGKDGKEFVLNGANYMTARENGTGDIIKYATDHNPEWKTVFDSLTSNNNYRALTEKIQSEIKDNKQTVETTKQWTEANASLRNKLENSTTLLPTLDESAWQFFNPGKEWNGSEEQLQGLRSQVIDEIMNNYAATDQITSRIQTDVTPTELEKLKTDYAKLRNANLRKQLSKSTVKRDDYSGIAEIELNAANNIIDSETAKEKGEKLVNELNKLAITEGKKYVLIYDESSGEITRQIDPKFSDQPGTVETYITNEEVMSLTRNDIMDLLNLNRGKSGIPVKEFSRYIPDDNTSSNFDLDVKVDTDVIKTNVDSSYGDSSQKIKSDPKKQVVGTSEEEKTKALLRKVKNIKPEEFKKITGKDLDQQTKDDMRDFIQEKGLNFMNVERQDEISKIIKKLNRNKL